CAPLVSVAGSGMVGRGSGTLASVVTVLAAAFFAGAFFAGSFFATRAFATVFVTVGFRADAFDVAGTARLVAFAAFAAFVFAMGMGSLRRQSAAAAALARG